MKTKPKTYPYVVLLAGLPKGIAEKACKNAENGSLIGDEEDFEKISSSLFNGFYWGFTIQGDSYWSKLYRNLKEAGL